MSAPALTDAERAIVYDMGSGSFFVVLAVRDQFSNNVITLAYFRGQSELGFVATQGCSTLLDWLIGRGFPSGPKSGL